jgi:16S rRNA (guanine527-N7)-methyltransferase
LDNNEQQKLHSWAQDYGIELSDYQIRLFGIYLDELWEWNKKINLTGLSSRQRIITELLLDSLITSPFLPEEGSLLDVGSGAGFPGIPLKICKPQLKTQLMEANSKKVNFLKQVIRVTKLYEIEVIKGRIEKDGSILSPKGYHIITARALAPLAQTLAWCAPYLMPGGLIVNFQGGQFAKVLEESADIIKEYTLFLYKSVPYKLPGKDSQRHILIFMKNQDH